jgi:hypothetical protein
MIGYNSLNKLSEIVEIDFKSRDINMLSLEINKILFEDTKSLISKKFVNRISDEDKKDYVRIFMDNYRNKYEISNVLGSNTIRNIYVGDFDISISNILNKLEYSDQNFRVTDRFSGLNILLNDIISFENDLVCRILFDIQAKNSIKNDYSVSMYDIVKFIKDNTKYNIRYMSDTLYNELLKNNSREIEGINIEIFSHCKPIALFFKDNDSIGYFDRQILSFYNYESVNRYRIIDSLDFGINKDCEFLIVSLEENK